VDVSIISVSFNSLRDLRRCIPSIYEWTRGISFEIIIVDNASPAGDIDGLKEEFPAIKLIKSSTNLGFAGANNLGVKHAAGDWVLFLNPDTLLTSPALNLMLDHARSIPDLGIAGCKLLNEDGSVQTSSILKFPGVLNSFFELEFCRLHWPKLWGIGPLFSENPEATPVRAVSGACMLTRRQTFEALGMFSEEYFMYSEDLDLCYKAERSGLKNYHIGQASIVHYGGTSSVKEWQAAMKTEAELHFCAKWYGRFYTLLFRASSTLNALMRLATITVLRQLGKAWPSISRHDSAWIRWTSTFKVLVSRGCSASAILSKGIGCAPAAATRRAA